MEEKQRELRNIQRARQYLKRNNGSCQTPWIWQDVVHWMADSNRAVPLILWTPQGRISEFGARCKWLQPRFQFMNQLTMRTKFECIKRKRSELLIPWQTALDQWILGRNPDFPKTQQWQQSNLQTLCEVSKEHDVWFIIIENLGPAGRVYLDLKRSSKTVRTRNGIKNTQRKVGVKMNCNVLIREDRWHSMQPQQQAWHQQLCWHILQMLMDNDWNVGNHTFCYKYKVWQHSFGNAHHLFFCYDPEKPLKSLQKFYQKFGVQGQRLCAPSNVIIDHNADHVTPHHFWLGIKICRNAIRMNWKRSIIENILRWNRKCPKYLRRDVTKVKVRKQYVPWRFKYYDTLWYEYNASGRDHEEVAEARKQPNAGLHRVEEAKREQWLCDLIADLQRRGILDPNAHYDQVGINWYANPHTDRQFRPKLDQHDECDKFQRVDSLTVYSDDSMMAHLSFALRLNKTLGECKVPLFDCSVMSMTSPGWALDCVKHGLSQWEICLEPNQFRIVILFRVLRAEVARALKITH